MIKLLILAAMFIKNLLIGLFLIVACTEQEIQREQSPKLKKPNIILIMADDLGWGDTGYNDHPHILTPNLDSMATNGVMFKRFYAAAPVCSPTRGSCLTGRNPNRYGIFSANVGSLPQEEITLAEILKEQGYTTGHFGKWHLGTLTKDTLDANRGGKPNSVAHFSPPTLHGFDENFSTESKVPTWNPMQTPVKEAGGVGKQGLGNYFGTAYWDKNGKRVTDNLEGDDSRIIMDRVIPFIENAVENDKPFFTVIWFHTPHTPVVAGEEFKELYKNLSEEQQHYYGCISAMDKQIGRLRQILKNIGEYENTLTFFTSDNGPENDKGRPRSIGITKGLSERKRSLKEGGIRVPGILEFPALFKKKQVVNTPFFTSDYLPSILKVLGIAYPDQRPLDGESMFDETNQLKKARSPMVFKFQDQVAVMEDKYKIYSTDKGKSFTMFDLETDPQENIDVSAGQAAIKEKLEQYWVIWEQSQENSLAGKDYQN